MSHRSLGHPARSLALLAALLIGGCVNLFEPATPQPPDKGSTAVRMDYSDAEATLQTLSAAITAKDLGNGKTAYAGGFADEAKDGVGFTTTFDTEVARAYEQSGLPLPTWNLDLELNFFTSFVGLRTETYILRWGPFEQHGNDELDSTNGLATLHRKYEVFLRDASGNVVDEIAVGNADLRFKRFGSRWAIVAWDDFVDPSIGVNPSDTDLRSFSYRRLEAR